MIKSEHQVLWDSMRHHQSELSKLRYKMRQLSIEDQIEILKHAFLIDDGINAWDYLLKVEPINFRGSDRQLTKGLFDIILGSAVLSSKNELDAQELLTALVIDFPKYKELIYSALLLHLDEADRTSDYEVYQKTCDLLIDIKSDRLDEFLKRCREHENPEIRDIDEDWDE